MEQYYYVMHCGMTLTT